MNQSYALSGQNVIDLVKESGLDWHTGFDLNDENRFAKLVDLAFNLGLALAPNRPTQPVQPPKSKCQCEACLPQGNLLHPENMRMIVCATCGNKRCPHATNHLNVCTGSNDVGQKGSSWEGVSLPTPQPKQPACVSNFAACEPLTNLSRTDATRIAQPVQPTSVKADLRPDPNAYPVPPAHPVPVAIAFPHSPDFSETKCPHCDAKFYVEREVAQPVRSDLTSLVRKVHKAKGRYHTQLSMCDLYDACGFPNFRPGSEPVQPATVTIEMSRIAQYKLDVLIQVGYIVNGYAVERRHVDRVIRGLVTEGGKVCWWHDDEPVGVVEVAQPAQEPWPHEDTAYRPGGLAQPEQEAVYQYQLANGNWIDQMEESHRYNVKMGRAVVRILYTSPPQRQPLTHEQRVDLLTAFEEWEHEWNSHAILIDMVEAAHGIKETK